MGGKYHFESLTCSPEIGPRILFVFGGYRSLEPKEGSAMRKSQYTEEQIAFALRQAEQGTSVAEVIRKMGISE